MSKVRLEQLSFKPDKINIKMKKIVNNKIKMVSFSIMDIN